MYLSALHDHVSFVAWYKQDDKAHVLKFQANSTISNDCRYQAVWMDFIKAQICEGRKWTSKPISSVWYRILGNVWLFWFCLTFFDFFLPLYLVECLSRQLNFVTHIMTNTMLTAIQTIDTFRYGERHTVFYLVRHLINIFMQIFSSHVIFIDWTSICCEGMRAWSRPWISATSERVRNLGHAIFDIKLNQKWLQFMYLVICTCPRLPCPWKCSSALDSESEWLMFKRCVLQASHSLTKIGIFLEDMHSFSSITSSRAEKSAFYCFVCPQPGRICSCAAAPRGLLQTLGMPAS